MKNFKEILPKNFDANPFELIGNDWMLVTAAKDDKINTMTASWGGFGVMWGKNVAYVVIRPQRYTKEFVDQADGFSLSFFDKDQKSTLSYLGSTSGRDEDKITKSGLTVAYQDGLPYFEEAEIAVFCKKLYAQALTPESFLSQELIGKWYPDADFHTLYIAEVNKILIEDK